MASLWYKVTHPFVNRYLFEPGFQNQDTLRHYYSDLRLLNLRDFQRPFNEDSVLLSTPSKSFYATVTAALGWAYKRLNLNTNKAVKAAVDKVLQNQPKVPSPAEIATIAGSVYAGAKLLQAIFAQGAKQEARQTAKRV